MIAEDPQLLGDELLGDELLGGPEQDGLDQETRELFGQHLDEVRHALRSIFTGHLRRADYANENSRRLFAHCIFGGLSVQGLAPHDAWCLAQHAARIIFEDFSKRPEGNA